MADKYLNLTDLTAIKTWIEGKFGLKTALETLEDRVDDIVAEGGEPNVIETVKVNGTALTPDAQKAVDVEAATHFVQVGDNGAGRVGVNYSDDLSKPSFGFYISRLTSGDPNTPLMMGFTGSTGQQSADPKSISMIVPSKDYVDQNGGKIDTISVNGTQQTITNKNVDIPVPTATSDLTNDSDYQNETEVQALIDASLADITGIDFQVVQTLPATGQKGIIYLVPKTGTTGDIYDEYIWVTPQSGTAHFEQIGTTEVDLSEYWTMTAGQNNSLIAATVAEVNAILEPSA